MAEIFCYFLIALLGIAIFVLFFSTMYLVEMDKQREVKKEVKVELPSKSFVEDIREIWACFVACFVFPAEKLGIVEYDENKKEWKWK